MSIEGYGPYQESNRSGAEMGRIVDLDLNYPPPSETIDLTDPPGVQVQGYGHHQAQATAAVDDEVVVISPRKFAEAMSNSRRNQSRRSGRVIEGLPEELTNWPTVSQIHTFNWGLSLNLEACNEHDNIVGNIPVPPVVPHGESLPEPPTFTCPICLGEMSEETSTRCGHVFCKTCIDRAIATSHKCPTCRRKLGKRNTFRNQSLSLNFY